MNIPTNSVDAKTWVAMNLFKYPQGWCRGSIGGGSCTAEKCDTYFICDWCGQEIKNGVNGPCPKSPFPQFTVEQLMNKIADNGHHVMIRVDPERKTKRFTLVFNGERLIDTDNPLDDLCQALRDGQITIN